MKSEESFGYAIYKNKLAAVHDLNMQVVGRQGRRVALPRQRQQEFQMIQAITVRYDDARFKSLGLGFVEPKNRNALGYVPIRVGARRLSKRRRSNDNGSEDFKPLVHPAAGRPDITL